MIARTTIESSGPKTLTDSEGFFGEAPPHEDIEALAELLVKGSYAPDPIAAFSECVRRGEDLQVDCLVATITPSINIAKDGADHDAMRDYFHRVSDVGQVRMQQAVTFPNGDPLGEFLQDIARNGRRFGQDDA